MSQIIIIVQSDRSDWKITLQDAINSNFSELYAAAFGGGDIDAATLVGQPPSYYLDRANHTGEQAISTITNLQSTLNVKADLIDGKVPASQLPSYVDDVLEYADLASFPVTGETGKIYVAIDTLKTYRWTGSVYVEVSAQAQADWAQTNSSAVDFIKNKPTFSTSTKIRSLDSSFQISTSKSTWVYYSVEIESTLGVSGGEIGNIYLETPPDNSVWTTQAKVKNGNTGTLTVGLSTTQTLDFILSCFVPIGYYVRLRTEQESGTSTFTYITGQETQY